MRVQVSGFLAAVLIAAALAWLTVLPTIGFLWSLGVLQ